MTSNYHDPHAFAAPLTSAEVNAPLGQLDQHLTNALETFFYATEYGVVADNSTDNTSALQAAIDAAEANGGGVVILPPGTIRLNSGGVSIEASGVSIRGAGINSTVLYGRTTSTPNIISIGSLVGTQQEGNDLSDFQVLGDDANTNYGIYMRHAAVFSKMTRLKVWHVKGTPGIGIGQSDNADDEHWTWTYAHCIIRNNTIGMQLRRQWQHTVILDCVFTANTTYGLDAMGNPTSTNGGKLFIYGGTMERNGNTDATTGSMYLQGVNLAVIRDLYGEQNSDFPGFWLKVDSNALGPSHDILVEGNYFTGSSGAAKGIIVTNVGRMTVRNNRARNFTSAWLSLEPGTVTDFRQYENTDLDVVQGSQIKDIPVPLGGWVTETGSPAAVAWPATGSAFERMLTVAFDQSTSEGINLYPVMIPHTFLPNSIFTVHFIWSTDLTSTNVVVWQAWAKVVSAAEAASGTSDIATSVNAAASATQYALVDSRVGSSVAITASPGDIVRLSIRRKASDAADTLAGDAYLVGVYLTLVDSA